MRMPTIQTPDVSLNVVFSPDVSDGSLGTFTLTTEQGEVWCQGPCLNKEDVLVRLRDALAEGHEFIVSETGVFATRSDAEVRVFCGPHMRVITGCVDGWWAYLTADPDSLDALFHAMIHEDLIPSTVVPEVVYIVDNDEGGWLREIGLEYGSQTGADLSVAFDDVSGRCLVCPDDHSLRIVELCAEPCAHYGPYRIMKANQEGQYHPVHEVEDMESAKAVAKYMATNGAPEPLPAWREDMLKVIRMPHGMTAVMYPHFTSQMDIWMEEYFADILDHNGQYLTTMAFSESMADLIPYRDNPAKFLDYLAEHCPQADLSDHSARWSEPSVSPVFSTDVDAQSQEVSIGRDQKLVIHALEESESGEHWFAELYLSDSVVLHINKFTSFCRAQKGLSITAHVTGVEQTVRVRTMAQDLGPVVQQVLSGKISEAGILAQLTKEQTRKADVEDDGKVYAF